MKLLTTRQAKRIELWIHNAVGIGLLTTIAVNLSLARQYRDLQDENIRITIELIEANEAKDRLQAVSLKCLDERLDGISRWATSVSRQHGIKSPSYPPTSN